MNKMIRDSMTMLLSTLFTAGVTFVTDIISRNILGTTTVRSLANDFNSFSLWNYNSIWCS